MSAMRLGAFAPVDRRQLWGNHSGRTTGSAGSRWPPPSSSRPRSADHLIADLPSTITRCVNLTDPTVRPTNQLLAALPIADWQELEEQLEWVELHQGEVLYGNGMVLRHVYFPTTASVSLVSTMQDGASAESAVVGNEGMVGVCAYMGGKTSLGSAVVQRSGHAWRMSAPLLARQTRRSDVLLQQLLRFTQALFTQLAQTSACNLHHALDQQLCRWLLLNLDRIDGDHICLTQERIAGLLGVRREGVTVAALKLQRAGLIRCARGRISVLDRDALAQRSCECYPVIRLAYDGLSEHARPRPTAARTVGRWPANQSQACCAAA